MKKHIFWIVPVVLYILLLIINQGAVYFNRSWFNVKHAVLFGLIVYVLLTSLYFVYRFFIRRYKEKRVLKYSILTVLCAVAITGTVFISNQQIRYIDAYEVPHIKECTYYDEYGNAIYKNYLEVCPELNIIEQSTDRLLFTVSESYEGQITEPYEVENGIGYIYYDGILNVDIEVEMTYRGPYVDSHSFTFYQTITKKKATETESTVLLVDGYMYKETMSLDHGIDDQLTASYVTQSQEVDMTNKDEFPSFDEVEEVKRKYVSTKVLSGLVMNQTNPTDAYNIVFEEITYDEEGIESSEIIARGTRRSSNKLFFGFDFYEEGIATGYTTDYAFDINETRIVAREPKSLTYDLERNYDVRTITFTNEPPYFSELTNMYIDLHLFSSFDIDSKTEWLNNYNRIMTYSTIEDEPYLQDSEGFYHKLVSTSYGLRVEEYELKEFSWSDFLGTTLEEDDQLPSGFFTSRNPAFTDLSIKEITKIYDYKSIMMFPGSLSNLHFYQHNLLVEFPFIDNYDKYDEK